MRTGAATAESSHGPRLEAESSAAGGAMLSARVEALEQSVRSLERRLEPMLRAVAASAIANGADERPRSSETKSLIDDPVFEAAVIDVMDRAAEVRSSERERRRDERRKEQLERWATDLTERLGLTPSQRTGVLEIRANTMTEMQRVFGRDAGAELPPDQQRARAEAVRAEAEAKLTETLDSRQLAEYQKLDPELKVGRGPRGR
jgi:hypothetical protein